MDLWFFTVLSHLGLGNIIKKKYHDMFFHIDLS